MKHIVIGSLWFVHTVTLKLGKMQITTGRQWSDRASWALTTAMFDQALFIIIMAAQIALVLTLVLRRVGDGEYGMEQTGFPASPALPIRTGADAAVASTILMDNQRRILMYRLLTKPGDVSACQDTG